MTDAKKEEERKAGQTLAVIGCGTMGTAILSGVLQACKTHKATGNIPQFTKFLATVHSESSENALKARFANDEDQDWISISRDNLDAVKQADVIILAFKPYMIDTVLSADAATYQKLFKDKLIISVLVGSPTSKIENAVFGDQFGEKERKTLYVKRAMPNIGARYAQSMTVIETNPSPPLTALPAFEALTEFIFSTIGPVKHVLPSTYDISGVLAGASGAFLSVALDGILDGAVSQGLKRGDAREILTGSLKSLTRLLEEGEHPAMLREMFSSPKGTTIRGLLTLEEEGVRWGFARATERASERSIEIGEVKR